MSLPFAFLAAALVSLVLPVAAVLLRVRTRSGPVWEVLSCSLAAAFYLTAVMRLFAQGNGPVPTIWLHALMASPVLLLLAGFMLSLSLGRAHPARSLLESYPTLALLAVPGAVALSLLRDPAFISGYDWEGGRATIHLGYAGKAYAGYLLIGVVLIGHNLERTYRFASPLDRRHLRGALLALCCIFGFATFVLTTGLLFSSVGLTPLAFAGLPIALAGALVAHGLLRGGLAEAAVVVPQGHGGLSFTTVAAGLFMLFIAGASQLAALIDGSPAAILVVAAGALAILIAIVLTFSESSHRKVRCLIDRSLYANHRDVRTQWSRTAESLRDAADCETLLDRTAAMCVEAFGADAITIALENAAAPGFSPVRGKGASGRPMVLEPDSPLPRQLGRGRCALLLHRRPHDLTHVAIHAENQDWLGETASQMIAPLLDGTRLVGTIGLERQARRAAFTCEDLALLDSMALHVATVLNSIRRAEDRILILEGELISKWSNALLHETRLLHAPLERALADLPLFGHIPGVAARSAADISRAAVRLEGWGRTFAALRNHSPLAMSVASPNEIVRESLSRFQIRGTASIEMDLHLDARQAIRVDRALFRQALDHLLANAIEAMEGIGRLSVSTKDLTANGSPRVQIEVTDTGSGIPEGFLKESLFRPFATTKRTGLGLGLWQCRSIVRAHGGEIGVESRMGAGTTFRMALAGLAMDEVAQPSPDSPAPQRKAPPGATRPRGTRKTRRLLAPRTRVAESPPAEIHIHSRVYKPRGERQE